MNEAELSATLEAIELRGDPNWTTPSGPFLDLIREFVTEDKPAVVAESCGLYFSVFPNARTFVMSSFPGILINNDQKLLPHVKSSTFHRWSQQNPKWADWVRDHVSSTELVTVVELIRSSVLAFAKEAHRH